MITRLRWITRKGLMKFTPKSHRLGIPCTVFILNKAAKINIGPNIYVSTLSPGFIIQLGFLCFNVEIICGFILTFVSICYANSIPFGFTFIIILKLLVTTLKNQDNKVTFILVNNMEHWKYFLSFLGHVLTCTSYFKIQVDIHIH